MRSAGCVINDLWDRNLDKEVERTKMRPIATGEVTPKQAVALLACLLTPSLAILLSLNYTCIAIGVASMIPVVLYPLAKRVTQFPQLVLGLTFNVGAIMGYTAVTGHLNLQMTFLLYMSCIMWTLHYDTIYALQDVEDDRKVGIKSLARFFLDDPDINDTRRLTSDRLIDQANRRKNLFTFLVASSFAHTALLSTACYLGNLHESIVLPLVLAMGYSISKMNGLWDEFTLKEKYSNYFNKMAHIGLFVSLCLMYNIYRSDDVTKENKNCDITVENVSDFSTNNQNRLS